MTSLAVIVALLLVVVCVWVGTDARQRGAGMPTRMLWMLGVFLLWPVFLPGWLLFRPPLPTRPVVRSSPPPGWYRDPDGHDVQRWWDGQGWTEHTT